MGENPNNPNNPNNPIAAEPKNDAEVWARFRSLVGCETARRRRVLAGRVLVVLISLLLAAASSFLAFPTQVRALGHKLETAKSTLSGYLADRRTPSDLKYLLVPDPVVLSTAELRSRVSFPVHLPAFMPEGYELVEHIYDLDLGYGDLRSTYRNGDRFISIRQWCFGDLQFGAGVGFDKDDSRLIDVEIRGFKGFIIERAKDGWSSLTWIEETVTYDISGHLSVEEIIQLAESFSRV